MDKYLVTLFFKNNLYLKIFCDVKILNNRIYKIEEIKYIYFILRKEDTTKIITLPMFFY